MKDEDRTLESSPNRVQRTERSRKKLPEKDILEPDLVTENDATSVSERVEESGVSEVTLESERQTQSTVSPVEKEASRDGTSSDDRHHPLNAPVSSNLKSDDPPSGVRKAPMAGILIVAILESVIDDISDLIAESGTDDEDEWINLAAARYTCRQIGPELLSATTIAKSAKADDGLAETREHIERSIDHLQLLAIENANWADALEELEFAVECLDNACAAITPVVTREDTIIATEMLETLRRAAVLAAMKNQGYTTGEIMISVRKRTLRD